MRISGLLTATLTAALLLGGCVTQSNQKQMAGGILGAGLGGFAGSKIGGGKGQLAAVAVGTLAGAMLGSNIGESLDKVDRLYAGDAQKQATSAPVGQTVVWRNPDTGHSGSVTPVRDGRHARTGQYCREYQTDVEINGRTQTAYGTSCRQPDGSWKIIN